MSSKAGRPTSSISQRTRITGCRTERVDWRPQEHEVTRHRVDRDEEIGHLLEAVTQSRQSGSERRSSRCSSGSIGIPSG
jgi:hypothetical protein